MTKPTRDEAIGALSVLWHHFDLENHGAARLTRKLDEHVAGWRNRPLEPRKEMEVEAVNMVKTWVRARDVLVWEGILK